MLFKKILARLGHKYVTHVPKSVAQLSVCVCVCECVREKEKERERKEKTQKKAIFEIFTFQLAEKL